MTGWKHATAKPERPRSEPAPRKAGPRTNGTRPSPYDRACAYVATMQGGIEGSGGSRDAMRAAIAAARGFALSEDDTFAVLREHHNPKCEPPWSDKELAHKATSAFASDRVPLGYLLDADRSGANEAHRGHGVTDDWRETPEHGEQHDPRESAPDPDADAKAGSVPDEASTFERHWVTLSDCPSVLIDAPTPQKWLFTRYEDRRDVGVFPRGKTGLLVGAGGVSKTNLATQWGVAVALGSFLLETFRVSEPGHVLMALAEEELDECTRRLWRACNVLELSADQRKDIAQRIHLVPLHGVPVALLRSPSLNVYEATTVLSDMKKAMLARGVDWTCVILDPLARWSGGGAERDNEAATRFVQIVENITKVRGNPSGLVVHHSSQVSIASGSSAPRGVTGLHDGFRWVANMDAVKTKDGLRAIKLANSKSNYSPEFEDLLLIRNSDRGIEGTLRLATTAEAEKFGVSDAGREKAKEDKTRTAFAADCDAVLAHIPLAPGHIASDALDAVLRSIGKAYGDKTLTKILRHLAGPAGGDLVTDLSSGAQSKPRQWARTCEVQS